ncbi:hypothetical protein HELRODRAFT_62184, partial [Helobdella robusta]|uniref:AP-3 complex subunit beta n=1 Tax=Helobdella robusta TaxID=6412 RepID=T1FWW7_HELRO
RHEDLKQMLDNNKDSMKLEAMKRIIGMVAKGKDASDLFPAVVKNVVSKNIEVKKLVYVYLTRYAEEQQDLALLSISTFQRALKDPNQLIRGSALRVLSSIRVPMIVPIMMLAIKESVSDMSPYVRKTAAHAIPKLYSLDPEQKDLLIEVIEKLLADKTTLVAGSAIQAFEEVCPERIDLIHKNYRKLCNLLVDVEEWGQVVIINMLTRYCRLQFVNPNQAEPLDENDQKAFYGSSDESDKEGSRKKKSASQSEEKKTCQSYVMDPDHRLLLRTCRPLLNSRNAAVVMAVAQLYHHCAPKSEVSTIAKALIRLLRGHKEVQYVVLTNIASMSVKQKLMFEPYLKSFFVRFNDPAHVKLLKLEILTNLANDANISTILREFQTYVSSSDKELAAATIQSIGRCATTISEITDTCLNGLVNLLSNRNEAVVGESVIVIKKLLQMRPSDHKDIIVHMAKMTDHIAVPMAKASILWLIGEYSDRVPKIAPDVLRKMAKNFVDEEDIVKLQILNLATKLYLTNPKQTKLLCQYVFNLAKYDINYDIRDRARFLRQLVSLKEDKTGASKEGGLLAKHAKKILLAPKPVPVLESRFKDMDHFQLGTLSHAIGVRTSDYQELPDWPDVAPDPSVRNIEPALPWSEKKKFIKKIEKKVNKPFFSDEEEDEDGDGGKSPDSSSGSGDDSSATSSSLASADDSDDDDDDTSDDYDSDGSDNGGKKIKKVKTNRSKTIVHKHKETIGDGNDSSSSATDDDDDDDGDPDSDSEESIGPSSSSVLNPFPILTPSLPLLQSVAPSQPPTKPNYTNVSVDEAVVVNVVVEFVVVGSTLGPRPAKELLNRMSGAGISIYYSFSRTISIFCPSMVSIELVISNEGDTVVENIRMGDKKLGSGMSMQDFTEIAKLAPGNKSTVVLLVDFNDTTQSAQFEVCCGDKKNNLSISPPVGEIIRPHTVNEKEFFTMQGKLGGMNENSFTLANVSEDVAKNPQQLCNRIFKVANILLVPCQKEHVYLFAGRTASSKADVLVSISVKDQSKVNVKVNCDKIVIGSMLAKDIKESLLSDD